MLGDSGGFRMLARVNYLELIKAIGARVPYSRGGASCGYCGTTFQGSVEDPNRCPLCGSMRREPFRTPMDLRLEWVINDLLEFGWITFTYGDVTLTPTGRAMVASTDIRSVLEEELAAVRPPQLDPRMQVTARDRWAAHLQDLEEACKALTI